MTGFWNAISRRAALAAGLAAGLALLVAAPASAQSAAAATGSFLVVHGIPGRDVGPTADPLLPVDVQVNGSLCLIKGLAYQDIAGPFTVPAGTYAVKVSLANSAAPCSSAAVISTSVAVRAGSFASVVAALSPTGTPTAYAFADNLRPTAAGSARVIAAHAAAAPPVDIKLTARSGQGGTLSNLAPGNAAAANLPGDRIYRVTVAPHAAPGTVVIGPLPLSLPARSVALAFAVGSATSGSITLLVKTIPSVF